MNNKVLIGFGVFLAAFLLMPFALNYLKTQNKSASAAVQNDAGQIQAAPTGGPPYWNAENLVNTKWQVMWERNPVQFVIAPGGLIYANHPMAKAVTGMDRVEGEWSVKGDIVHIKLNLRVRVYEYDIKISGMDLYMMHNNEKVVRIQ